jgi:hypothetical protein
LDGNDGTTIRKIREAAAKCATAKTASAKCVSDKTTTTPECKKSIADN